MLKIKPIFGSAALEVFAFKCCAAGAWNQNLEVQLTNDGREPVCVPNRLELFGKGEPPLPVEPLTPVGEMVVEPGETRAFYGYVDEAAWQAARRMIMRDAEGRSYEVDLNGISKGAGDGNNKMD